MKGLILKDLYNLRSYSKTMIMMFIIFGVVSFILPDQGATYFSFIAALLSGSLVTTTLKLDSQSDWDSFAVTMPVGRRELVWSKYILMFILSLGGAVLGVIVTLFYSALVTHTSGEMIIGNFVACLCGALFLGSLSLPFTYKFGEERSRVIMIGVAILVALLLVFILNYGSFGELNPMLSGLLNILFPVIVAVVFFVSRAISGHIFNNKEL